MKMSITIEKPYENKEIDNRWIEVRIKNHFNNRSNAAACIQAGNIYLYGGSNQCGTLQDLYSLRTDEQVKQWIQLPQKKKKPGKLRNHTLNCFKYYLILCGGQINMFENNSSIYIYDLRTNQWNIAELNNEEGDQKFPSLQSHSAIIKDQHIYILFGYQSTKAAFYNSIYRLDLSKIAKNKISFKKIAAQKQGWPCQRSNSACCLFKDQIYVYGGINQLEILGDMWCYSIEQNAWSKIQKADEKQYWPEKRKSCTLVLHQMSGNLFMFGGLFDVTRQKNDIVVFLRERKKWVRIHTNTNNVYEPSPLIRKQIEDSPTILAQKRKRAKKLQGQVTEANKFRLSLNTTYYDDDKFSRTGTTDAKKTQKLKTHYDKSLGPSFGLEKKKSMVQQQKYKEFLTRKKSLLHELNKNSKKIERQKSPTSQAILMSLKTIGNQEQNPQKNLDKIEIPKVIFDEEKGYVIGKKPCARDGHIGLSNQDMMIIIGGDRHNVSFNDFYYFKMNKAMETVFRYL